MSLTLHYHPFASFCQKVLIALYELDLPFTRAIVDLADPAQRAALVAIWPIGKFPVLCDAARDLTLPESTLIIEYLDQHYGRDATLIPRDPARALVCRLRDRFYDLYVNTPMAKIVIDNLRPVGGRDPHGVAEARQQLDTAYGIAETWLAEGPWALGDAFGMADCAAAPALLYAHRVHPFGTQHPRLRDYLARVSQRPSFARVLDEAAPFWVNFPG